MRGEIGSASREDLQNLLSRKKTVLYGRTPGLRDSPDRVSPVHMDQGPQAQLRRFIAYHCNLLVAERLPPTVADAAGRGKHLDQVRAIGCGLPHSLANLFGAQLRIINASQRGE